MGQTMLVAFFSSGVVVLWIWRLWRIGVDCTNGLVVMFRWEGGIGSGKSARLQIWVVIFRFFGHLHLVILSVREERTLVRSAYVGVMLSPINFLLL